MTNLTVVGHFSTALLLAWIVWLLWCAWQVHWYRRAKTAIGPVAVAVDTPAKQEPIVLRAPDASVRSMSSAPIARTATQPIVDAPRVAAEPAAPTAIEPQPEAAPAPDDVKPAE